MPGKVLIADDSLRIQKELSQLLTASGVEVATVSNGEHAVRQLPTVRPDIVLADIFMPVRTGYEVCEYVKHHPDFEKTAVLLLVSKMEPFDEKEAQRVGFDGKIEKPFGDPQAVLAFIQEHLQRILGEKPPPPINEFAEAVPADEETTEPEPEVSDVFATAPEQVEFDEESTPMGFTEMLPDAAEEAAEPVEDTGVDLGGATIVTTADELRRRIEAERVAREDTAEEFAEAVTEEAPAEATVEMVEDEAEESMDLSGATMLTTADELRRRIEAERKTHEAEAVEPAPVEEVAEAEAEPAAAEEAEPEVVPTQEASGGGESTVEQPELAAAWEMTGPEPGAPEIPAAGGAGWESQWKDMGADVVEEGEEAPDEEAAPAEEVAEEAPEEFIEAEAEPAPTAGAYPPDQFAAAFSAAHGEVELAPAEGEDASVEEAVPVEEDEEVASQLSEQLAGAPAAAGGVDPALIDDVVNQVLARLSPQVMETIAREIVRPLAEALLREKLRD